MMQEMTFDEFKQTVIKRLDHTDARLDAVVEIQKAHHVKLSELDEGHSLLKDTQKELSHDVIELRKNITQWWGNLRWQIIVATVVLIIILIIIIKL